MQRTVIHTVQGVRASDGAGVSLVRVLGHDTTELYDPILMLDSFDSVNPADYRAGFPTHPHRGIETFSFIARGAMVHRDTMGNEARIGDGEAQFLSAGSGVFHSESLPESERLLGLQMWLNIPKAHKMDDPSYHNIERKDVPRIELPGGHLNLMAGRFGEHVVFQTPHLPLNYYDIHLEPGATLTLPFATDDSVMAFTLLGEATVGGTHLGEKTAAKLSEGDSLEVVAGASGVELIVVASRRLGERSAWYGPIVMNTESEIRTAVRELNEGSFLKVATKY